MDLQEKGNENGNGLYESERGIIFHWNIQSLSNKKSEVFSEMERLKLDAVVLTETKLKGQGQEKVGNVLH